jgi:alpha-galactosidase
MKHLFLCLFAGSAIATFAQTPDLTSTDLWKAENAPFSFRYAGKESSQFLASWQASDENGTIPGLAGSPDHPVHRYIHTDPDTKLTVTAEVRTFPDFPGAAEWVLYFKNGGSVDTPIIENILPLHWSFPTTPGGCTIHHAKGSSAAADDFKPLEEQFGPGGNDHLESPGGNPSSDNSLPIFNLQHGDHGYIGAIGWTGGWKADFVNAQDGKSISMSAGMKATHLLLHAGEQIRTPRIVLVPWTGGDWAESQNIWRRMVYAHYTPQVNGQALRGPIDVGAWGSGPIAEKIAFVNWIGKNKIPLDLYCIDAGWYGHSIGTAQISSEQDPTSPWWLNRGDWYPSPLYYPNGIGPLGAACKANGLGFSLWIEPETSMPDRKIVNEHPDWFLHSDHPVFPGVMMANYGDPACLKGITDMVSGLITDFGMTVYRQDFNIPPADYWGPHDTPDRVGMTEIGHIEGLYQFLDTLLAGHPGMMIDSCASGGRRFDIEMMSRSFVMGRSDHDADDPLANQALTQGLAPWNPQNSSFMTLAEDTPWSHGPPYSSPLSLYRLRIGYGNACRFFVGATGVTNQDWIAWIKQAIGEYKDVQPYMYGDFYALTPYTLDDTVWTAWQYNRPDKKDGCVILLRRGGSPLGAMDLGLHHLDPNATYEVEVRRSLDKEPVKEMKGSELANLRVTLDERPDSEIIFYRQK